jgi:hypothetical protein
MEIQSDSLTACVSDVINCNMHNERNNMRSRGSATYLLFVLILVLLLLSSDCTSALVQIQKVGLVE